MNKIDQIVYLLRNAERSQDNADLMDDAASALELYHEALEKIANYTYSQAAALNIPKKNWHERRAWGMQRISTDALKQKLTNKIEPIRLLGDL
jgi:hypothetical protein